MLKVLILICGVEGGEIQHDNCLDVYGTDLYNTREQCDIGIVSILLEMYEDKQFIEFLGLALGYPEEIHIYKLCTETNEIEI